jgi:hypothetical protein
LAVAMDATQQAFFMQMAIMAGLAAQAQAQAQAQAAAPPPAATPQSTSQHRGRTIENKDFFGEKKFSHGEQEWRAWSANFEVRLGSQCPKMRELLSALEKQPVVRSVADVYATTPEVAEAMNLAKTAGELYEVLFLEH